MPEPEDGATTRRRILESLRSDPATPSELAAAVEITPEAALRHVEHVARSVEGTGERLLVAPPACRDCGFDDFDDLLNRPSRCPSCKSESVSEPTFTVTDAE